MYLFLNGKETVTPDIRAVPVGETVTVTRKHEPMGLLTGKVEARNLTYKLTTVAVVLGRHRGCKTPQPDL
jgi:hypothetical protein